MGDRTIEEQQRIAQMGGIASGAVRRKKAAMRDYAQFILGIKRWETLTGEMAVLTNGEV